VTSSAGLRLVELNPTKILPDLDALLEYNHLRKIYIPDLPSFQVPATDMRNFPVVASLLTESKCHSKNFIGKCPTRKTTMFKGKETLDISTNINKSRSTIKTVRAPKIIFRKRE